MRRGIRGVAISVMVATASLVVAAGGGQAQSGDVELAIGHQFFADGRYADALDAFERSLTAVVPADQRLARSGAVMAALRAADFTAARTHSEALVKVAPHDPDALALYADALWSSGLFEEAEIRYREALALAPRAALKMNYISPEAVPAVRVADILWK
jgi:tetratricopeptide (TPR) repeat protein